MLRRFLLLGRAVAGTANGPTPWRSVWRSAAAEPSGPSAAISRASHRNFGQLPRDKFAPEHEVAGDTGLPLPSNRISAADTIWPMDRHQQKFAKRLSRAMHAVVDTDHQLLQLFKSTGLSIVEVRPAPDLRTAYIRWDAYPLKMDSAERGIKRNMNRLRALTSKKLGAKFMPRLEFRRDELTADQAKTEAAILNWEREIMQTDETDIGQRDLIAGKQWPEEEIEEPYSAVPELPRGGHGEATADSQSSSSGRLADGMDDTDQDSDEDEDPLGGDLAPLDAEGRIADIIDDMTATGASEDEMREMVHSEIRSILQQMVEDSGGPLYNDDSGGASVLFNRDQERASQREEKDVFTPSHDWQEVPDGVPLPEGLHIRMNVSTGKTEAKLL